MKTAQCPDQPDPVALAEAIQRASHTGALLLAMDFDGTLAPLRDDPETSAILPEAARAIEALATVPTITIALVSGRPISQLHRLAHVPEGTILIGSHGGQKGLVTTWGLTTDRFDLNPEQQATLAILDREIGALASGTEGAWMERKPAAVVLHVRLVANPEDREQLLDLAMFIGESHNVRALPGSNVTELAVIDSTKGQSISMLRRASGSDLAIYIGDDVTDEDAFRALPDGDIGIKVGSGPSAATIRVTEPRDVARFLTDLAMAFGIRGR